MTAQQPIVDAIYALLSANSTVSNMVPVTRIYDSSAPQDPVVPFIVTTIITDPVIGYFNAIDSIQVDFQVDIYGQMNAGGKATRIIGDAVFAALHRQQNFTMSGYSGCSIMCTNRGNGLDQDMIIGGRTQQDAWRQTQTYRLWGTGN